MLGLNRMRGATNNRCDPESSLITMSQTPINRAVDRRRPRRSASKRAPGFSVDYVDFSVDPRRDFYGYAVGKWVKTHPVPPDKTRWGAFNELREWNMSLLHAIAEECSKAPKPAPGSPEQLVGDFYRSGMNTRLRQLRGFTPVEDLWNLVSSLTSIRDLPECIAELHSAGVSGFFNAFSRADKKNSSVYALYLVQGGLSLPDREYYTSDSFSAVREDYRRHIANMFRLKGVSEQDARRWADTVLEFEKTLAAASRTRTDLRDQEKNYNRFEISQLNPRFSALDFPRYLDTMKVNRVGYVVVGQPEFFDAVNSSLSSKSLDDWKVYMYWHILHSYAPYLHRAAEEEDFDFFQRRLLGQKKMEPKWKRVVSTIDELIGEALGKLYVERHFPDEARKRMALLVDDIRSVFRDRLKSIPWMTEQTRQEALRKFDRFNVKIGHPETFRDYAGLVIDPMDYAGNVRRAAAYEVNRQAARVGQPVDRKEWHMTPPTVNAYFSPTDNEIVFPAGILQPPFFDFEADDAVNYGGIGTVIGHEITHGFDDQGRRYDSEGNLRDWWTPKDAEEFGRRASEVVKLYSSQEALPGAFVKGELTLGENIADFGGVSLAYEALQRRLGQNPDTKLIDGLTPEQRFFISYAQIWRQNIREQELRRLLTIDPHSPAKYRATLPAVNHPAFDTAFPPKSSGDELALRQKIAVW